MRSILKEEEKVICLRATAAMRAFIIHTFNDLSRIDLCIHMTVE